MIELICFDLLSDLTWLASKEYLSWICCREHIKNLEVKIIGRNFSPKEVQKPSNGWYYSLIH